MTDKTNDGGPAFPGCYTGQNGLPVWSEGMTLRDYFAAKEKLTEWDAEPMPTYFAEALAGPMPEGGWGSKQTPEHYRAMLQWEARWRAELKYIRADAMIKARGGQ